MEANTTVRIFLDQSDVEMAIKEFVANKYPQICSAARGIEITNTQSWNFTVSIDEHRTIK